MKNIKKKNIENEKLELINWILNINDEKTLKKILSLKDKNISDNPDNQKNSVVRKFGFAKGTFTNISEDFDDELSEFNEYMP